MSAEAAQLIAVKVALLHAHRHDRIARSASALRRWSRASGRTAASAARRSSTTGSRRQCRAARASIGSRRNPRAPSPGIGMPPLSRMSAYSFSICSLQPVEAALAHHELQPRLVLVLAVAVLIEDADHGLACDSPGALRARTRSAAALRPAAVRARRRPSIAEAALSPSRITARKPTSLIARADAIVLRSRRRRS